MKRRLPNTVKNLHIDPTYFEPEWKQPWIGNKVSSLISLVFQSSVKGCAKTAKKSSTSRVLPESSRFVRPPTINSFPCDYSFGVYPTMAEKKHAPWGAERMRALQDAKH